MEVPGTTKLLSGLMFEDDDKGEMFVLWGEVWVLLGE